MMSMEKKGSDSTFNPLFIEAFVDKIFHYLVLSPFNPLFIEAHKSLVLGERRFIILSILFSLRQLSLTGFASIAGLSFNPLFIEAKLRLKTKS